MKADKVYVGEVRIITHAEYLGNGVSKIEGRKIRTTFLYKKKDTFFDLYTNEQYYQNFLPVEGTRYLDYNSVVSLAEYMVNTNQGNEWRPKMSKRKMKKISK